MNRLQLEKYDRRSLRSKYFLVPKERAGNKIAWRLLMGTWALFDFDLKIQQFLHQVESDLVSLLEQDSGFSNSCAALTNTLHRHPKSRGILKPRTWFP